MRYLILGILILAIPPVQAENLTFGLEYGTGFFPKKDFQSETKNNLFGLRLQSNYNQIYYGLGYQRQELNYNFSKGYFLSSEVISNNLYLYLAPRWLFSNHWDISFENRINLNNSIVTGVTTEQKYFSGVGIGYSNSLDQVNYRLGLNLTQGLDFSHSATLAMVGIEFRFKSPKKAPSQKANVLIKNVSTTISGFDYKKSFLKNHDSLSELKLLIEKSNILEITIIGHTDKVGGPSYNLNLGYQRAEFVKSILNAEAKIDSRGLTENISPEDSVNRRVEIVFKLDVNHPNNKPLIDFINRGNL